MLVPCSYSNETYTVELDDRHATGDFEYLVDTTFVGRMITERAIVTAIAEVRLSELPVDPDRCCRAM